MIHKMLGLGLLFSIVSWQRNVGLRLMKRFSSRFRPIAGLFVKLAKMSLAEPPPTVQDMQLEPHFREEVWDIVGRVPVADIRGLLRRTKVFLFKFLYRQFLVLPANGDGFCGPQEMDEFPKRFFGDEYYKRIPRAKLGDLSVEILYEQIVIAGFYDILPRNNKEHNDDEESLYSLDLQFLREIPVKDWCYPCGGEAVISLEMRKVICIITPENQKVFPTDKGWALEAFRFRSSLFQYCTVMTHATWSHAIVAAKVFLATHSLPQDHPLKTLLRPFVHDIDKIMARASFTVFDKTGVLNLAGSFTQEGVETMMRRSVSQTPIRLLNELYLDRQVQREILPLWDEIYALVSDFVESYGISELHPETMRFKQFIVSNIAERLGEFDITFLVTYLIFTMTVSHQLWGHIHSGTTDSRNVSACTRKAQQDETIVDVGDLYKVSEAKDSGILRMAIIVSTSRDHVKLSSDFSPTTNDPLARRIFRSYHERMKKLEENATLWQLVNMEDIASSAML